MRPIGETHSATSRRSELKRADKFDRREMDPHKERPRLTPEMMRLVRMAAAFRPAPPEADVEDPDYGF